MYCPICGAELDHVANVDEHTDIYYCDDCDCTWIYRYNQFGDLVIERGE